MAETQDQSEPTFEQALARLERIVVGIERGEVDLATALVQYEEGVKLLAYCRKLLDAAEARVAVLTGVDPLGTPTTAPFDATATFNPETVGRRPAQPADPSTPAQDRPVGRKVRPAPRNEPTDLDAPPF